MGGRRVSGLGRRDHPLGRGLPWVALAVGVAWTMAIGSYYRGIRSGGDTKDYLIRVEQVGRQAMSFESLYQPRYQGAHMTTVWMRWLGPRGFVAATVALTALLPWLSDSVLRRSGAGPWARLGALAFIGANPELYKWAWFVLSDGLFLIQVALLLALLAAARASALWWVSVAALLYSVVYTRPTGLLVFPGVAAFALASRDRRVRWGLLALCAGFGAWVGCWLAAGQVKHAEHADIARRTFVGGHLLQNPHMGVPLDVPFSEREAKDRSVGELCGAYPAYCARYVAAKLGAYFVPVYPKYSSRHRAFNAVYFGSLSLLSVIGAGWLLRGRGFRRRLSALPPAAWAGGAILLSAGAFHTLTHVDSDARYLIVWTPVWIISAWLMLDRAMRPAGGGHEA
ncbi:MAG TPA: hypothetical protein VGB20_02970 [bacterium]